MAKKMWQYLMIATLIFGAMGPMTSVVAANQVEVADTDTSATDEKHEVTNNATSETEKDADTIENSPEIDQTENLETPQGDAEKAEQADSSESPVVDQESTPIDETDTSEVPETDEEASIEEPEANPDTQEDASIIEEDEPDQTSDTDHVADVASSTDEESLEDESNSSSEVTKEDEADKIQEDSSSKTSEKKTKAEEFKLHAPSVVLFSDSTAPYQASVTGEPNPTLEWTFREYLHPVSTPTSSSALDFYATLGGDPKKPLVNLNPDSNGVATERLEVTSGENTIGQDITLGGLPALKINAADFKNHGMYFTIAAASSLPSSSKWDYHWEAMKLNPGDVVQTGIQLENFRDELTNISGTVTGKPSDSAFALKSISNRTTNKFPAFYNQVSHYR